MKKGKMSGIIILAAIALIAFGGNKNKASSPTTKSNVTANNEVQSVITQKPTSVPTKAPTPTPEPTPIPELKSGSKGEEVESLQELLISFRYLPGPVSGIYDNATVQAIKDFQINNRMIETGVCNQALWEKITSIRVVRQSTVYKSKKGKVYHSKSNCSGMKTAQEMTLSDALRKGLTPCSHCH